MTQSAILFSMAAAIVDQGCASDSMFYKLSGNDLVLAFTPHPPLLSRYDSGLHVYKGQSCPKSLDSFTSHIYAFVLLDFTLSLKSSHSRKLENPPRLCKNLGGVKLSNLGLNLTSLFAYISSFLNKRYFRKYAPSR